MRGTPISILAVTALLLVGCPNTSLYDFDGDGHPDSTDCAPEDPSVYPDAPDPEGDGIDSDCDGVDGELICDADGDGYVHPLCGGNDCDDNDPLVNASMAEVCDGKDTDCDGVLPPGEVDLDMDGAAVCEGDCDDSSVVFNVLDEDGDGYTTCDLQPDCDDHNEELTPADLDFDGYSTCSGDCNDLAGLVHPLADELCDGLDTDCDGEVPVAEADGDGDGHAACADCDDEDDSAWGWDEDGDGFDPCEGDCDETSTSVHPGAYDPWGDGQDDDCSGADGVDWDGDGWPGNATPPSLGNPDWDCDDFNEALNRDDADGDGVDTCAAEPDCDDAEAEVLPGAPEDACDGVDTDCVLDELEVDDDGDGWLECEGDCDDSDSGLNLDDADADGVTTCAGDCDDLDAARPGLGAWEAPGDGIDTDCNGQDAGGLFWAPTSITGVGSDWTGWRVAGGGDVDGDGLPDIAVGSPGNDLAGSSAGAVHVFWATTVVGGGVLPTSSADVLLVGELANNKLGKGGLWLGGDLDGDGQADLLAGAPHNGEATGNAGKAYAVASSVLADGGQQPVSLAFLSLLGEGGYAFNGYAIDGSGDFDGDGLPDFVSAAHAAVGTGRTYVVLTGTAPLSGALTPGEADVVITGPHDHGFSVAALPDIDGDGLSELLVGNPGEDAAGVDSGSAWLFYGSTLSAGGDLGAADVDVVLEAEAAGDLVGHSVASAGDVDGDTVPDILIGAPGSAVGGVDAGRTYLLFGADLPPSGSVALGSVGAIIDGGPADLSGTAVAAAGDLDGDGLGDILIGAPGNSTVGADAGAAYIFLGSSLTPGAVAGSDADHVILGEAAGDEAGFSVAGAGDVDGDGYDDILVGATGNDDGGLDAGKAYLLLSPYL